MEGMVSEPQNFLFVVYLKRERERESAEIGKVI